MKKKGTKKKDVSVQGVVREVEGTYETKLMIKGDLDTVLKVLVSNPNPMLVKRRGNSPKDKKSKK